MTSKTKGSAFPPEKHEQYQTSLSCKTQLGKCNNARKWCKASWYRKGKSGKIESEAIPRSWVSRSRSIVKWPPSHINFKSAIEACMSPMETDNSWTSYVLVSCTHSVDTLEGAQQLQTEMSESGDETTDDEVNSGKDANDKPLGRGFRVIKHTTKLVDYESGRQLDDTTGTEAADEEDDRESRQEVHVKRVIAGGLGDTSGSATQLQHVANMLSSADPNGKEKTQITMTMRKALSTNNQGVKHVSPGQQCTETDEGITSVNPDESLVAHLIMPESEELAGIHQPVGDSGEAKPKNGSEISDAQMKTMLTQLAAESKLRHSDVMNKLQQIEKKLNGVVKAIKKHKRTFTATENEEGSLLGVEEFALSSDEEMDMESQFCVDLPVDTFDDFRKLEQELEESSAQRKVLRGLFDSLGGRSENDVVLKCISKVIQRPQLAQHFNCGGVAKSGTLLLEPTDKENFMGSQCQKIILRVLRKKYPRENESSIRTRASDVLKRSSGLKGGDAYRAKKLKLKKVNKKLQQIPCDESPDSSDSDSPKQKRQKISSDASVSKDVI